MNLIYPVIVVSVVMMMIIFIPVSLSEKIPLFVTLLLVISVYQLIILDALPSSTDTSFAE